MSRFFTALFVVLWSVPLFASQIQGVVLDVHDGDTIGLQVPDVKGRVRIRLVGVDTPEVDFNNTTQGETALIARDYLASLVPVGTEVTVVYDANGFDRHTRILGRVIRDGVDINKEMLLSGWGYMYFIFPFDRKMAKEYSEAATLAAQQRRGLFSEQYYESVEAPYDFRLQVRNQVGRNLVADIETRRIYSPDEANQVPYWRRVYFPNRELALENGYH